MKSKFIILIGIVFIIILSTVVFYSRREVKRTDAPKQSSGTEYHKEIKENDSKNDTLKAEKEVIRVEDISFERLSGREIRLTWSDRWNPYVREYSVQRRREGESLWEKRAVIVSDGRADNRELSYVDVLEDAKLQQYVYRIDLKTAKEALCEAGEGKNVLASNILVCIDPGHYAGQNTVNVEGIPYAEGDFTLELALELRRILKESYGITVYLTRESGSISIGGYTDDVLDNGHISLRGEYAAGSDLFLSLHTNANLDGANGYPTNAQPVEIMKPIIIVNTAACENEMALEVGNAVGIHLAQSSYELGIALPDRFKRADHEEDIIEWTDAWNDDINVSGTICRRLGEHGDYYGVLRGAASVGVPGMIIEHGFHTVPEMRKMAAFGELKKQWARADAEGIAEGFGLSVNE